MLLTPLHHKESSSSKYLQPHLAKRAKFFALKPPKPRSPSTKSLLTVSHLARRLLKEEEILEFQVLLGKIAARVISDDFDRRSWSLMGNEIFSVKSLTVYLSPSSPMDKLLYLALWIHMFEKSMEEESKSGAKKKESFDGSRKDINIATDRICEFTGTKIVFWDLREPFIDGLYKPSVFHSRLEALIEPLDTELSKLCDIIVEPLRDRIVTSLLQASLDGLLRVILDGGPSRVFSTSDSKLLEEDLEVLKEFFISGGDGLPRGVVENLVAHVRDVIKLHGYETRELIEDLRSASGGNIQSGRYKAGADSKTLLRILCHRSDSEASQFLKKQYKIPSSSV